MDGNTYSTATLDPNGNGYLVAGSVPTSSCIAGYIYAQSPTLPGGSHMIGACIPVIAPSAPATATAVPITVNPLTPTVTLAAGGTLITSGFADTLTATLGGFTGLTGYTSRSSAPTGTVTFTDTTTATVLGTASVVPTISFSGNVYTYGATAQFTTTDITAAGANAITATYNGDSNYNASTSTAVTLRWEQERQLQLLSPRAPTRPPSTDGQLTATIAGAQPTAGTVTFYDGQSAPALTGNRHGGLRPHSYPPAGFRLCVLGWRTPDHGLVRRQCYLHGQHLAASSRTSPRELTPSI